MRVCKFLVLFLMLSLFVAPANAQFGGFKLPGGLKIPSIPGLPAVPGLPGGGNPSLVDPNSAISEIAAKAVNADVPLKLDQNSALPAVDDLVDFQPKHLHPSLSSLDQPLPPGDYAIDVIAYCTQWSIHVPGRGLPYKLAHVQGRLADAISALIVRGTLQGVSCWTLNADAWRIQSGTPLSQWPDQDQALIHHLIPEDEKRLQGDYLQQVQSKYDQANKMSHLFGKSLPPLDTILEGSDAGRSVLQLWHSRQVLADKNLSADRIPDMLYQATGDGTPLHLDAVDGSPSPWSEVQPGIIARYTIQGGNMQRNLFEFRILPAAAHNLPVVFDKTAMQSALLLDTPALVGKSGASGPTIAQITGMGSPAGVKANPYIGYPKGRGAQDLIAEPDIKNNGYAGTDFVPGEWKKIGDVEAGDTLKINVPGTQIAIEASSDAGPLPTLQFEFTLAARPENADGTPESSIAAPQWFEPVPYSSGFTGAGHAQQYVFQSASTAPQQQWIISVPAQEDTHGNYTQYRLAVYAKTAE